MDSTPPPARGSTANSPKQKVTGPDEHTERIGIRCTPTQKAILAEAAKRAGLDVSSYLRSLGMKDAAAQGVTEATVLGAAKGARAGRTPT